MNPQAEFAQRFIAILDAIGLPYMVVGSWASSYYGERRATQDIDIVVVANEAQLMAETLPTDEEKYFVQIDSLLDALRHQSMANILDYASGDKVDLIFLKADTFDQACFSRRRKRVGDIGEFYLSSPEDVILSKLRWASSSRSEKQRRDVFGVLCVQGPSLDLTHLRTWADKLGVRADLEELLTEAQLFSTKPAKDMPKSTN